MDPFEEAIAATVETHRLWQAGEGVVAGVSGGPDSTALLAVLAALSDVGRGVSPGRVVVAHLDHGLRGESSRRDARFVEGLARRFGFPYQEERVDVAALAKDLGTSLEAAGRTARYRFFTDTARKFSCGRIAVGHHRGDQVETILMRCIAGTGSDGLAGMRFREGDVVRPLLDRTRDEILAYLLRKGIPYREDASNRTDLFLRNRIRNELLPFLRERFNHRVDEALWRMSLLLRDEVAYLEAEAQRLWERVRLELPGGVWLDAKALGEAPVALRRRVLRLAYWQAAGAESSVHLEFRHVEELEALFQGKLRSLTLPSGLEVRLEQGRIRFGSPPASGGPAPPPKPAPRTLPIPGRVAGWGPWAQFVAEILEVEIAETEAWHGPQQVVEVSRQASLDYEALGRPDRLIVRTRRPGDRMRPLGAPGRRELQDLFVDRRVPRSLRDCYPIITRGEEGDIVWVPGVAVADPFRIRAGSRSILRLRIEAPQGSACCEPGRGMV